MLVVKLRHVGDGLAGPPTTTVNVIYKRCYTEDIMGLRVTVVTSLVTPA
jgi:hypothetical protein